MDTLNCPFEKTILSSRFGCECGERYCIAEREGIGCGQLQAHARCRELNTVLHEGARFALKLRGDMGQLPHGKEMKVLYGGLLGLQRLLQPESEQVTNIFALVEQLLARYESLEQIPLTEVMPSVVAYEHRRSRR